jgi:SAM-dependent methyltransferase
MTESSSGLRSYSSGLGGPFGSLREAFNLARAHSADTREQVRRSIAHLQTTEALVEEYGEMRLRGLEMLDVGAGQRLTQLKYFSARGNDVVGVDRDVVVHGFDPLGYLRMARSNGLRRMVKTAGRKVLRFDTRFNSEFERHLGSTSSLRRARIYQCDASRLPFVSETFDFSYSMSVLQYVEDPLSALREMGRVVKSGGGAYVDFMLYTGPSGCLDIRALGGRGALPHWVHLRDDTAEIVRENAPLNQLRLATWRALFAEAMPGSTLVLDQPGRDVLESEAQRVRENGELLDYSIEELVTTEVRVVWRKP